MALQQISFPFGDEPREPAPAEAPPTAQADAPAPPPTGTPVTPLTAGPETPPPPAPVTYDAPTLFLIEPITPATPAPPPPEKAPAPKGTRGRKSLKELAAAADLVDIPGDDVLFQKQYYGIGEVAAMFNVNTSLIRFWETEFSDIKPRKNKKGDRYFTPADIKTLELIHFLLRQKKLTIEGAKEYLKANRRDGAAKLELVRSLEKIKAFLLELKARL